MTLLDLNREELKNYGAARNLFQTDCEQDSLDLDARYFDHLYQVLCWLVRQTRGKRFTFGISGAQGSGKSTFAKLLAHQLDRVLKGQVAVASLDDFYLGREARAKLAEKVHPLLMTRGVPGTHDVGLLQAYKRAFVTGRRSLHPRFSKADDDRARVDYVNFEPIQCLLFEGWCWGAEAVSDEQLIEPVNELEANEDPEGTWRQYVNEALKSYAPIFECDHQIFLQVPSIGAVRRWRWQQEKRQVEGKRTMSPDEVHRFVMHFERITKDLLARRGTGFDLLMLLDEDHQVERLSHVKL